MILKKYCTPNILKRCERRMENLAHQIFYIISSLYLFLLNYLPILKLHDTYDFVQVGIKRFILIKSKFLLLDVVYKNNDYFSECEC